MRRFVFFLALAAASTVTLVPLTALVTSCSSTASSDETAADGEAGSRRDGGLVQAPEAGAYDAGGPEGPEPSCAAYCDLITANCKDGQAQYASLADCLDLCGHLPPGDAGDKATNTVACRQYYAGSPARTDAPSYCLAAGPFGGGVCGDRCTAFCGLALAACSPSAPLAPYAGYPDCQTACAGYPYKDGGVDGGGEPPLGPETGDTLNCRLFHVRSAVLDGSGCIEIGVDSGACR
jgi:hypothetical protein